MASNLRKDISGVVIIYNPEIKLIDNIISYIDQVDKLFIFDNSTDKIAYSALSKKKIIGDKKVDYIVVHHTELDHTGA